MSHPDPTAIKMAIANGATWAIGNKINDLGTMKYPYVDAADNKWKLGTQAPGAGSPAKYMRESVFNTIRDGDVVIWPDTGELVIQSGDIFFALEPVGNYAQFVDP